MDSVTPRRVRPGRAQLVCILAGFFFLLVLVPAQSVHAHAGLIQSDPQANEQLLIAPAQIELFFSEPIENGFSTIEVLSTSGKRVDNDDSLVDSGNPTRLTVSLRSLPVGIYTVSWRVLSAVDNHVTAGVYPFAVGDVDAAVLAAAAPDANTPDFSTSEVVARYLTYLAMMWLTGSALFFLLVWDPVTAVYPISMRPSRQQSARFAILVLLSANLFWLQAQVAQVNGTWPVFPWQTATTKVLFMTRFGTQWSARLALAVALLWVLRLPVTRRSNRAAVALALLLPLTLSIGSHAAAKPDPLLPILADWVHLAAAGVWVGGLFHFLTGLPALRSWHPDPGFKNLSGLQLTALLIPRFSLLAAISLSLLVLSGTYASILQVGSWAALVETVYGRVLLLKLAIFLPMAALGSINLLFTSRRMKQAAANEDDRAVPFFRRLLTGEVALGVLALLSVSLLTAMPVPEDGTAVPTLRDAAQADDLDILMEVTPGKVGMNTFRIQVEADQQPVDDTLVREVTLQFTPTTNELPPGETRLTSLGNGLYETEGGYLSMPDAWQVQVAVRRSDAYDSFANFYVNVGVSGRQAFPWHRTAGLFLLMSGILYVPVLSSMSHSRIAKHRFRWPAAAALLLIGGVALLRPPIVDEKTILPNPIPPNADSIAIGKGVYQDNCVPCHGVNGAGDGPVGRTLNPPPANLIIHTVPGVHPDGRLYNWITNGLPGSVMPTFNQALSDEERWHLVNYLRTLSGDSFE